MPKMIFIKSDGERVEVDAPNGLSILEIAHQNSDKVFLEGACEGSLACSTCHVIIYPVRYSKLSSPHHDEIDMLDLAPGITKTSRLGCQIRLTDAMDGLTVQLPQSTTSLLG